MKTLYYTRPKAVGVGGPAYVPPHSSGAYPSSAGAGFLAHHNCPSLRRGTRFRSILHAEPRGLNLSLTGPHPRCNSWRHRKRSLFQLSRHETCLSRERCMTTRDNDYTVHTVGGCSVAGCVRSPLARCIKCRREICGHHSEYCECCGETFCPACYTEHARGSQPG